MDGVLTGQVLAAVGVDGDEAKLTVLPLGVDGPLAARSQHEAR